MNTSTVPFRAQLDAEITDCQRTPNGIPLLDIDQLDLKEAQAAALISALADIVEAACVHSTVVPMTHAAVA